jgi:hypothetical protein
MTAAFWAYALPCLLIPWAAVTGWRSFQRWRGRE